MDKEKVKVKLNHIKQEPKQKMQAYHDKNGKTFHNRQIGGCKKMKVYVSASSWNKEIMCCVGLCKYGWTICYNSRGGKGVG